MDMDSLRAALLAWYDVNARELPWRVGPARRRAGVTPDPYRVWLSEVMLQQTTIPHATRYFHDFTRRWPAVQDLAGAPEAEVMAAWAGLGYYARARNLLACARAVARVHGGRFPDTEGALRALPGLGPYTAAAVAAIAFDRPANVVDGNVERVTARLFAVEAPLPAAKPELRRLAATLVTDQRPGDWAQSLMDLGATICRPKAPLCERCPVAAHCAARASREPDAYPRRTAKAARPHRAGCVYVLTNRGAVALVRRPDKGLLGGMLGLPTGAWVSAAAEPAPPLGADWIAAGRVTHVFTHFSLDLEVLRAEAETRLPAHQWLPAAEARLALPSVFRKALDVGLQQKSVENADAGPLVREALSSRSSAR
ncbi:MAG TPA: A/G-specific adenine glycosylase [Caulobacteraceae bacterium]|jgi:A/G-specific adenine glycosylase